MMLTAGTQQADLEDVGNSESVITNPQLFKSYGRLVDCRPMGGFAFVEFENSRVS